MVGCMLPMPFLCLCEHVAFTRTHADTSVCTFTDTHTYIAAHRKTHNYKTHGPHKMLQAQILSLEAYSEIYGINNLNSIIFSPIAFKIMHAWLDADEVLPTYLPGYRCVQDLLCDLVSCNLHLLIRRLQKGWNERRSD